MATITSSGVGSGLDVNGIVTQLMAVEKQPLTALDTKEASYQAKISAYGTLKSSVFSLKTAADALKAESLYTKMSATVSDSTLLTATANSVSKAGNYTVQVVALAKNQALASQDFTSKTADISTIDGKLKIEIGTYSGSAFTADSMKTAVTIDIAAGSSSLEEIRDQINAANAGVKASVVSIDDTGTKFKLAITSNTTGAAGSVKITAMDSSSGILTDNLNIARLSYDPTKASGTGNEYAVTTTAQDANIKVDGVSLYRNSNTIGDAITGISLTALKEGTTTLKIGGDTTSIRTALESFVTAYNDTITLGRQLSNYDTTTNSASILTGETAARSIMSELRTMIGLDFTGTTGSSIKRMSDLGLAVQRDGTLQINTTKMVNALNNSLSDVTATLTTNTSLFKGIAVQMSTRLGNLLADNGAFGSRLSGINASIKDIGKQRTTLNTRLIGIEKRYRTQFTSLDTLVASMQRTSQYLTQQLAGLSSSTK